MKTFYKVAMICLVCVSTSANSALLSRLGGSAFYDDVADLTWATDANLAQTSGYDADGKMNHADALAWVANLNIGGVTGWGLAETVDFNNDGFSATNIFNGIDFGYNITTQSDMSDMFYNVLGNTSRFTTAGVETGCLQNCTTNTGPFINIQNDIYWSTTNLVTDTSQAWTFGFGGGSQGFTSKSTENFAWAVLNGDAGEASADVSTYPPLAFIVLGLFLMMLIKRIKAKA